MSENGFPDYESDALNSATEPSTLETWSVICLIDILTHLLQSGSPHHPPPLVDRQCVAQSPLRLNENTAQITGMLSHSPPQLNLVLRVRQFIIFLFSYVTSFTLGH